MMSKAWFVILFGAMYGVACWLISVTSDGAEVDSNWIRRAIATCATPNADPATLDAFASEISKQASSRVRASQVVALGCRESHFDRDVIAGNCKPYQCDRGRARGAFQNHRLKHNAADWDAAPGNVPAQVRMAVGQLAMSQVRCAPFAPYPAHVFRAYRGGSCSWELRDEPARVAAYQRAIRVK